jgi:hypothetical protein
VACTGKNGGAGGATHYACVWDKQKGAEACGHYVDERVMANWLRFGKRAQDHACVQCEADRLCAGAAAAAYRHESGA